MLSKKAIKEFKQIYKKEFNEEISDAQAEELGQNLIELFKTIYRPLNTMPHIHDLIDFIVNVFIVYEDKVLLIHHKQLDKWLSVGGHIELDEDPDKALFREVKEECDLDIEVLAEKPIIKSEGTKFLYTPSFLDIHEISDSHKHVGLVYFAKAKSDKFIFNKEEHKDIKWFSKEDLNNPELSLSPAVKFYAEETLKRALKL